MNTTPEIGTRILVETKPFVDSDKVFLNECTYLGTDGLHWITERKPGSRHYIPVETIREWV